MKQAATPNNQGTLRAGHTFPARGIRKGSVQKTALRASASREALTAMLSSMGSSGGITEVRIMVQLRNSLKRSLLGSCKKERLCDVLQKASMLAREDRACAVGQTTAPWPTLAFLAQV